MSAVAPAILANPADYPLCPFKADIRWVSLDPSPPATGGRIGLRRR
jgi:hypothetical protein